MNKIYIRKITKQCITKQVSFLKKIYIEFFDSANEITIFNDKVKMGVVALLPATDPRFDNNIKKFANEILKDRTLAIGDFLVITKLGKFYNLDVIEFDSEYADIYNKLITENNRHGYIFTEDTSSEEDDNLESAEFPNFENQKFLDFRQLIFVGAPGTGKSYEIEEMMSGIENVSRVTFHPGLTYGSFIGSYKPKPVNALVRNSHGEIVRNSDEIPVSEKKISYEFVPGILVKSLMSAFYNNNFNLLIIEELSRGNAAAVFGDFFQLLDRNSSGRSKYKINLNEDIKSYILNDIHNQPTMSKEQQNKLKEKFEDGIYFPDNFYIWATMNSNDQGVTPIDSAFKRRWETIYFGINKAYMENVDKFSSYEKILNSNQTGERIQIAWNTLRMLLNERLLEQGRVSEDKLLGPYFLSEAILTSTAETLTDAVKNKVLLYLYEDVGKHYRNKIFPNTKLLHFEDVQDKFDKNVLDLFGFDQSDLERIEQMYVIS